MTRLGWAPNWTRDVVRECLPLLLVWSGKELRELSEADLDGFRSAVGASPAATRWSRRSYRSRRFSIRILLYEFGILAEPPRRQLRAATLAERFTAVPAAEIRRAMLAYVEARSAVLARSSLEGLDDPFARMATTLLPRSRLRLGECLDLELDCVVDYGATGSWLRVPLGKLASERMVPLDPPTVAVLDAWATGRGRQRPQPHLGPVDRRTTSCSPKGAVDWDPGRSGPRTSFATRTRPSSRTSG